MNWADAVFPFEHRDDAPRLVHRIWRTKSIPEESFLSVAVPHWELVVMQGADGVQMFMRGPETFATVAPIPRDAEFFGIQFQLGTFIPQLALPTLVDGFQCLNTVADRSVWLNDAAWEIPRFDNADAFVDRLFRAGVLAHDSLVDALLQRQAIDVTERTVQRRFHRATGLTYGVVRQIERAQRAVELLVRGQSILDVVDQLGYSDHAHLTRSLKRFLGKSPSAILAERP